MSTLSLDQTLTQLHSALIAAPEGLDSLNQHLRGQLEQLRRNPTALTTEQLQQARQQLRELAELAQRRLHVARRLQQALRAGAPGTVYGRHGLM